MFDYVSRLEELLLDKFCCSQALITLALEVKGNESVEVKQELLKAMSGLCGGLGGRGKNCGALTGGACAIGLFCGRGAVDEVAHDDFNEMIFELVAWFEEEYGSIECCEIVKNPIDRQTICPGIMKSTFEKLMQILMEYDVEIN